jgi:PadR family transcriptional regulator PadR
MNPPEMREPTFFVLASLADGRKHGYGIIKDVEQLSSGRMHLKVGTLYAALERLESADLIQAAGDEVVSGRLRRYFELTEAGASMLEAESERQERNARQARERLTRRAVRGAGASVSAVAVIL